MCWPENDYSYVGSGYAQTTKACPYDPVSGGGTLAKLSNKSLSLPVASSKSCQEDADCQHTGGGCMWSDTNVGHEIFNNICEAEKTKSPSVISACYGVYTPLALSGDTWSYGPKEGGNFIVTGRWPVAGVNSSDNGQPHTSSGAYCHKPTNKCVTSLKGQPVVSSMQKWMAQSRKPGISMEPPPGSQQNQHSFN